MKRPRLLLADDHKVFLDGLRLILANDYDIVGTVEDGRALVQAALRLHPDIAIADISMPELNGLEALVQLRRKDERIKVILLTMHHDAAYAAEAFRAGASGYVLKNSGAPEVIAAI